MFVNAHRNNLHKAEIRRFTQRVAELDIEIASLKEQMDAVVSYLRDHQSRLVAHEERLLAQETRFETDERRIDSLERAGRPGLLRRVVRKLFRRR